jgi:hypothetical protein
MLLLPWGPGDAYHFWWNPIDVTDYRDTSGVAPQDFDLVGEENVGVHHCYVLESRAGGYRMHVGKDDGRLYQRTWLQIAKNNPAFDRRILYKKIAGSAVDNPAAWKQWIDALPPDAQRKAWRDLNIAEFEFARPAFHHTLDDYREVAPGCWLAFHQAVEGYNVFVDEPYLAAHDEQNVTEVVVNEVIADELFHVELVEGVHVTTDWRYDPWIRYIYRKDQTEDERIALSNAKRKEEAQKAEREKRPADPPPPLPK